MKYTYKCGNCGVEYVTIKKRMHPWYNTYCSRFCQRKARAPMWRRSLLPFGKGKDIRPWRDYD